MMDHLYPNLVLFIQNNYHLVPLKKIKRGGAGWICKFFIPIPSYFVSFFLKDFSLKKTFENF